MIRLVDMDDLQFGSFKDRSVNEYAIKLISNGMCDEVDAYSSSLNNFNTLLPNGRNTQDHKLRVVSLDDGSVVGDVWTMILKNKLFLLYIFTKPEFRRRGIAEAVIGMLELECIEKGLFEIQLNVFGDNENAFSLYSKLGFNRAIVKMRKIVQPA